MGRAKHAASVGGRMFPLDAVHAVEELIATQSAAHEGQDWRDLPREDHIGAALRHIGQHGIDRDSGYPHDVHAAARLLMALEARPLKVVRPDVTGEIMVQIGERRRTIGRSFADEGY